jgi:hypothetical protein
VFVDQLWAALAAFLISTLGGLVIRAHLLDAVVGLIHGWTWLVTLPESAEVREELRTAINTHVAKQRAHYLNDQQLGSAETAIRLFEWQVVTLRGDAQAVGWGVLLHLLGAARRQVDKYFMETVARGVVRGRDPAFVEFRMEDLVRPGPPYVTEANSEAWRAAFNKALTERRQSIG